MVVCDEDVQGCCSSFKVQFLLQNKDSKYVYLRLLHVPFSAPWSFDTDPGVTQFKDIGFITGKSQL